MVSSVPSKIFPAHLFVYAQNHTGLQVQNLRIPVILNIFFKTRRISSFAGCAWPAEKGAGCAQSATVI
jgi:hypothetical protein